jgi:hypothetical protein
MNWAIKGWRGKAALVFLVYKSKEILYSIIDAIISFYFSRDPNVHYLARVYQ